jgi:hypothetical protein
MLAILSRQVCAGMARETEFPWDFFYWPMRMTAVCVGSMRGCTSNPHEGIENRGAKAVHVVLDHLPSTLTWSSS